MDIEKLIQAAAAAVIGALTKAAAEPALAAGGKVWAWLKAKVSGADAAKAAAVEAELAKADPKPSARRDVAGLLEDLLHGNPAAAEELQRLLEGAGGVQAITQTANVTGDNNVVANTAGTGNRVTIGR